MRSSLPLRTTLLAATGCALVGCSSWEEEDPTTFPMAGPDAAAGDIDRGADDGPIGDEPPGGDEEWLPPGMTASRFAVFYQVNGEVLDAYADPELGLPRSPQHAYVFAQSHASAPADRTFADRIHAARADFKYAPCFDLNDHPGWSKASDDELRAMAHTFRDKALFARADFFCLNEFYSNIPTDAGARVHLAKLLRYLNEPAENGARLRGISFLTEHAATPSNWTTPANAFWQAVAETSDAVVAEHYHGFGFVCQNSTEYLSDHLFALRRWLSDSGEPAKIDIASNKFVVLHSARYAPGASGWQGANSNEVSLAAFQRNLSRLAQVTRSTGGGINRISFAPVTSQITAIGVQPRIRALLRWHYGTADPQPLERGCVAGASVNCLCQ